MSKSYCNACIFMLLRFFQTYFCAFYLFEVVLSDINTVKVQSRVQGLSFDAITFIPVDPVICYLRKT